MSAMCLRGLPSSHPGTPTSPLPPNPDPRPQAAASRLCFVTAAPHPGAQVHGSQDKASTTAPKAEGKFLSWVTVDPRLIKKLHSVNIKASFVFTALLPSTCGPALSLAIWDQRGSGGQFFFF